MKRHLILIFVAMLMLASSAMAVEVTFSPRLTLRGEYTDNFYRTADDKQDEYISSVAPGATLGFRGATGELTLSYDPTYVTYAETDQEADWRHFGALNGYWAFSRQTRLDFTNSLTVSEDPADDPSSVIITQGRNRYTRYTGDAHITHQFGRQSSAGIGYYFSSLDNEQDYVEDSQERRPYLDLTAWFGESRYGMQTHIDYTVGDFETSDDFTSVYGYLRLMRRISRNLDLYIQYAHTVTDYDGLTEDYSVYSPSVGFHYLVTEQTTIDLALGYFVQDFKDSEDNSGAILTGDLTTSWSFPRGTFALTGSSGYRADSFTTDSLGFYYYAGLTGRLDYGFTQHFRGDLFGGYRYAQYFDTDPEVKDNSVNAGVGLSYQALSWMAFRLEYRYETVDSTDDTRELTENSVFLSVTFEPANPYRLN
jgi:hypothetical protein